MKAIKSQLKPMDPGMLECLGPRSNQCVLYRCSAVNLSTVRDCGSFITDLLVTPLPVGEQSIAMSVSVCLSVCPFSIAYRYLRNHVPKRHHIIGSSLATSAGAMCFGFVDDAMFAHGWPDKSDASRASMQSDTGVAYSTNGFDTAPYSRILALTRQGSAPGAKSDVYDWLVY